MYTCIITKFNSALDPKKNDGCRNFLYFLPRIIFAMCVIRISGELTIFQNLLRICFYVRISGISVVCMFYGI